MKLKIIFLLTTLIAIQITNPAVGKHEYGTSFLMNTEAEDNQTPTLNDQTFNVYEDLSTGSVIGTVTASDPDVGQTLTYAILNGNSENVFSINSSNGQISINTNLDFEHTSVYVLTIQVSDNGTPVISTSATLTINVLDVNESPQISNQEFTVEETATVGTVVGTVAASDPDAGQTLNYAILNGNSENVFSINSNTGQLSTNTGLNFELTTEYVLTIRVTDNGSPSKSKSATVTINVSDMNEDPQISNEEFTVEETETLGTVVGTVSASDPDAGQTLTYAILNGNSGDVFSINSSTGQISISSSLNFELTSEYSLTIQVSDNGTPVKSQSATVTINVTDVNENPQISDQTFSIDEVATIGTIVGSVTASDPDAGQTISFEIVGGNDDNLFEIDPLNGVITTTGLLSYQNAPTHQLIIKVTDDGNTPLEATSTVTVNLIESETTSLIKEGQSYVNIYPNPTSGDITINSKFQRGIQYILINNLGVIISSGEFTNSSTLFNLPKGLYSLKTMMGDAMQITQIVVQ